MKADNFCIQGLPTGALLLGLVLLGGCVTAETTENAKTTVTVPEPKRAAHVQRPVLEVLPFTVGVHYPETFKNRAKLRLPLHLQQSLHSGATTLEYPLGKGSVALLDASFQGMFEKIVPIEAWPPAPQRIPQISGAMVPTLVDIEIERSTPTEPLKSIPHSYNVRAAYTIELYTPSGMLLNSWTVKSRGTEAFVFPIILGIGAHYGLGDAIHSEMTAAVAEFVLMFLEQKDQITQWLSGTAHAPGVTP